MKQDPSVSVSSETTTNRGSRNAPAEHEGVNWSYVDVQFLVNAKDISCYERNFSLPSGSLFAPYFDDPMHLHPLGFIAFSNAIT